MSQIYDFERYEPPVLTEGQLRSKLEAKRAKRQTALVVMASVLIQAALIVLGCSAAEWHPWLTALCFAAVFFGTSSGVALAAVASRKGGFAS